MIEPNPNGANGTTSDPREQICWDFYVEGIAQGRENAYEAALKAGYTESSAKNITMRDWFKERLRKLEQKEMLSDAEKVLKKTLAYQTEKDGEVNVPLLRVQADVAKTVVTTLGKDEGYSTRSEITGKDGEQLQVTVLNYGASEEGGDPV